MVRSDLGGAGVMFSIDTESGFDKVVLINAAWGLGENVVQGAVNPDEYQVFKPLLDQPGLTPILEKKLGAKERKMIYAGASGGETRNVPTSKAERARFVLEDAEILELARHACTIERHYGQPMDMEWAKDGETGLLYIVQARPETVQSRVAAGALKSYRVRSHGPTLVKGLSVGEAVIAGTVCLIESAKDIGRFVDGSILVTSTTDPDWVPIMKRAAAIVTDHGGRTSHAAIVSRELGLPAIVGTGDATHLLHDEQEVTVSCAEGDEGFVYAGTAEFGGGTAARRDSRDAHPDHAEPRQSGRGLPLVAPAGRGCGARPDGIRRLNAIKVHPLALTRFDELKDEAAREEIAALTRGYADKGDYFVDALARGLSRIAAFCFPKPVIVRMSDFKTNEYANLLGGRQFEPEEENPMIGFRGASRYYSPPTATGSRWSAARSGSCARRWASTTSS
jgi:pyruvate, water dikinase